MWHGEFRHPRLVAVYDAEFGWDRDDDFFAGVVDRTPRARVVDLGCGTGRLALGLAAAGHRVTGVDPAAASLEAARARPGAEGVRWVEGTSGALPAAAFDVAVMTSHVAQFLVEEEDLRAVLCDLHRALVPGGRLVFDTRDPRRQPWRRWNPRDSRRTVELADGTAVEVWTEVTDVESDPDGDVVAFTTHYAFADGERLESGALMRFRSEDRVRAAVEDAGFDLEELHGGWDRQPPGAGDDELLVIARRRP